KEQHIEIKEEDIRTLANETAKIQFIRYGILNVQDEFLGDYVKNMLSDEKTVNELYQQTLNRKIIEEVKQSADVEEKEITSKELSDMLEKEGDKEGDKDKDKEKENTTEKEVSEKEKEGKGEGEEEKDTQEE
ncbi:MAG: hypothetical protein GX997_01755, partial [Bacteroidales bacterium]|nr:hypothetical protein [Bacteroidales bacterium]